MEGGREEEERRQLTRGLFNHEIRLSDEKQGGNRDKDNWRASGKEKKRRRQMKNAFQMLFKSG